MAMKVALVTGSNSGLGKSLALMLAKGGYKVWAGMRDLDKGKALQEEAEAAGTADNLKLLELDVNSDESVKKAFQEAISTGVRIDLLVNNAGFATPGFTETLSMDACKAQFETNLFGCIRCVQAAMPVMREQKSGKIVYISSVGGVWGQGFNDIYCASKFALEGLAESQCGVFREMGIYVSIVQPGGIKSAFVQNAKMPDMSSMPEDYKGPLGKIMAYYGRGSESQTSDEVAQSIMDQVVAVDAPPFKVQVNPLIQDIFKAQLADTTGEAGVKLNMTRLLAKGE